MSGLAREATAALRSMASMSPSRDAWAWRGWIPLGNLTFVIGRPGIGASLLLVDWVARISSGKDWPDREPSVRGNVILISADGADTLLPRLGAAEADLQRVYVLDAVRDKSDHRQFSLRLDLEELDRAVRKLHAVAVFIVPLSAFLGDVDSIAESDVRELVGAMTWLAERHRIAVVAELSAELSMPNPVHKAMVLACGGHVLAIASDHGDRERRLLVPVFVPSPGVLTPALAFRIVVDPTIGAPRIAWECVGGRAI